MSAGELFTARTSWFHIFRSMIDSGDLAEMAGSDLKVYFVVKSFTNFQSGRAFPSLPTIAAQSGLSVAQVKRCLGSLMRLGYIVKKDKKGRNNVYILREKVHCLGNEGKPSAVATWDYLPATVKDAQAEIKNFLTTGQQEGQIVHIEHLTLNVFNDQARQVNFNLNLEGLPPDLRKSMKEILLMAEKRKK